MESIASTMLYVSRPKGALSYLTLQGSTTREEKTHWLALRQNVSATQLCEGGDRDPWTKIMMKFFDSTCK